MDIRVHLTPNRIVEGTLEGRTAVVVDVLRASSTICTAFANGAKVIIPVEDMSAAGRILSNLDEDISVSGGERDGVKIDSFNLGNSPLEYTKEEVEGKTVVIKTTNGTNAIIACKTADEILIGCFVNAKALLTKLVDIKELSIVCSGWRGIASFEDCIFAGYLIDKIRSNGEEHSVDDGARLSLNAYLRNKGRLKVALRDSDHARRLIEMGFEEDVTYCSSLDLVDLIPLYKEDRIVAVAPSVLSETGESA